MPPRPFRFSGAYPVAAPYPRVVAALRDADRWPEWWPQIRSVVRYSDSTGLATVRSLLPITLRLKLTGEIDDPDTGVLRARIGGDLEGWIEFRVTPGGAEHVRVTYVQECVVAKSGLTGSGTLVRPLLGVNHTAMMRSGMRGLATYLQD